MSKMVEELSGDSELNDASNEVAFINSLNAEQFVSQHQEAAEILKNRQFELCLARL